MKNISSLNRFALQLFKHKVINLRRNITAIDETYIELIQPQSLDELHFRIILKKRDISALELLESDKQTLPKYTEYLNGILGRLGFAQNMDKSYVHSLNVLKKEVDNKNAARFMTNSYEFPEVHYSNTHITTNEVEISLLSELKNIFECAPKDSQFYFLKTGTFSKGTNKEYRLSDLIEYYVNDRWCTTIYPASDMYYSEDYINLHHLENEFKKLITA